jgi:hypothetical protein
MTGVTGCGTYRGYWNGCRCNDCYVARRADDAVKRRAKGIPAQVPSEHGTQSHYTNRRCRCDLCKAAQAQAVREYRARRAA